MIPFIDTNFRTIADRKHRALAGLSVQTLFIGLPHLVFVEFPGTSHEWQTWRKSLHDFAPRLFNQP